METHYQEAAANYHKWLISWDYYQSEGLSMARQQLVGATLSYQAGAIDYVTFLQNTHSAMDIELKGLEALEKYLQSKFYLEYLSE
jgi:cobalt-zinc-cadmium resistance protein CzcA